MFIDRAPSENCVNPESYGMLCVGCNQCGRIEKEGKPITYGRFVKDLDIDPCAWHPTVQYGKGEESPIYYAICPICGRFVKADQYSNMPGCVTEKGNATCAKHGRVIMPFCAWASEIEED